MAHASAFKAPVDFYRERHVKCSHCREKTPQFQPPKSQALLEDQLLPDSLEGAFGIGRFCLQVVLGCTGAF